MQRRTKAAIAGVAVVAAVASGTSMAFAGGADDDATDTAIVNCKVLHDFRACKGLRERMRRIGTSQNVWRRLSGHCGVCRWLVNVDGDGNRARSRGVCIIVFIHILQGWGSAVRSVQPFNDGAADIQRDLVNIPELDAHPRTARQTLCAHGG